ncbi:MAG: sigma-54-dependent Fis family transcriptional regulator [Candidatus Schekmanbacteria bacterium]|nr:sigma-54-dependent Fis family transcriptional regulator [Candidatus Schekmanbacteria bacterium]
MVTAFSNILLTFTGFHDPYSPGLIDGQEEEGPILSLLREKKFDRVILISTPKTIEITKKTNEAIKERFKGIETLTKHLNVFDPTDYSQILTGLRIIFNEINSNTTDTKYYIAIASGTPQMHACWLLLTASGEISATILNIKPKRFATDETPLVTEVDITLSEFPDIQPKKLTELVIHQSPDEKENKLSYIMAREGIIGKHPTFISAIETSVILAEPDIPILLLGESGTGKEVVANLIYRFSSRKKDPFVAVNCAAIPKQLAESFLFGHKKGAFTGALQDQAGKFDVADGGTLFLDELAELNFEVQGKLLRVLQDGIVEPLGSNNSHKVDVRIIAATNCDINSAISEKKFREDLYFRLNVGEIKLPSLRERRSDIPLLSLYFLDQFNQGLKVPKSFSPEALAFLQCQDWPGNTRELKNVVHRAVLISKDRLIVPQDLKPSQSKKGDKYFESLPEPYPGFLLDNTLSDIRNYFFAKALEKAGGRCSEAARLLGVSPQAVSKFVKAKNQL